MMDQGTQKPCLQGNLTSEREKEREIVCVCVMMNDDDDTILFVSIKSVLSLVNIGFFSTLVVTPFIANCTVGLRTMLRRITSLEGRTTLT